MTADFNNINLGKINPTKTTPVEKEQPVPAAHIDEKETAELTDAKVLVGQSSLVGKSQIKADNIANDIATFCANPKMVALANAVYDKAYEDLLNRQVEHPAEKAALISAQFVNEMSDAK